MSSGPLNRKPVQLHPICPRLMMLIQATLLHAKIVKDAVYYSWWSISRRIARHRRLFIERESFLLERAGGGGGLTREETLREIETPKEGAAPLAAVGVRLVWNLNEWDSSWVGMCTINFVSSSSLIALVKIHRRRNYRGGNIQLVVF